MNRPVTFTLSILSAAACVVLVAPHPAEVALADAHAATAYGGLQATQRMCCEAIPECVSSVTACDEHVLDPGEVCSTERELEALNENRLHCNRYEVASEACYSNLDQRQWVPCAKRYRCVKNDMQPDKCKRSDVIEGQEKGPDFCLDDAENC